MGRAERAFPRERGLPSPPANGRAHGPRHALRARGGLKVRAPEQCPAAAQGATGIPARDFPPVGRDRRARRDFNPKSAMENGVEPPRHQGTKKCGISRRGAEAQRGAATPPNAGGGEALRAGQGPGRGGKRVSHGGTGPRRGRCAAKGRRVWRRRRCLAASRPSVVRSQGGASRGAFAQLMMLRVRALA